MADAFENVVLRVALEVENNRLERLDTGAALASIQQVRDAGTAAARHFAAEMQKAMEVAGRLPQSASGLRGRGGPGGGYEMTLADEAGEGLISRRNAGMEEQNKRLADFANTAIRAGNSQRQLGRGVSEASEQLAWMRQRLQEVKEESDRVALVNNNRVAGSLNKVSNAAALLVVGYRALSQVNGEHVNVLGQWEGRIESSLIGVSVLSRGIGTAMQLASRWGVQLSAVSAGLYALPLVATAYLFRELARAQQELQHQQEIGILLDQKLAATMEGRRQKELSAERAFTDAVIGYRKKLYDAQAEMLERRLDTRHGRIGLTIDPSRRLSELRNEGNQTAERLNELQPLQRRAQNFSALTGHQYGTRSEEFARALEREKQIQQEIEILARKQLQNKRDMVDAESSVADKGKRAFDTLYSNAEKLEQEQNQRRGLSLTDLARGRGRGLALSVRELREQQEATETVRGLGYDPNQLRSTWEIDSAGQSYKQREQAKLEQNITQQKSLLDFSDSAKNELLGVTTAYESLSEAIKEHAERSIEISKETERVLKAKDQELNKIRRQLEEQGAAARRWSSAISSTATVAAG